MKQNSKKDKEWKKEKGVIRQNEKENAKKMKSDVQIASTLILSSAYTLLTQHALVRSR